MGLMDSRNEDAFSWKATYQCGGRESKTSEWSRECVVVIENSLRFLKPMLSQDSSIYEASLFGGFKLRAYSGKGVSRPTTKPEIAYIP